MDISEVAKRSGMAASTLRFYEEKGLIASVGRDGLRRRFAPGVLEQLALIALARSSGFSLDEIRSMFSPAGRPSLDRQMLAAKADEVDRTIARLKAVSRSLRHAAVCPAASHAECPTFQKLLRVAAAGSLAAGRQTGRRRTDRRRRRPALLPRARHVTPGRPPWPSDARHGGAETRGPRADLRRNDPLSQAQRLMGSRCAHPCSSRQPACPCCPCPS